MGHRSEISSLCLVLGPAIWSATLQYKYHLRMWNKLGSEARQAGIRPNAICSMAENNTHISSAIGSRSWPGIRLAQGILHSSSHDTIVNV